MPRLRELRDECDVRAVDNLRQLHGVSDLFHQAALLLTDPLRGRESALRTVRHHFPHLPVILLTPDPAAHAWLLEEGLVDLLTAETDHPLLRRAAILNLLDRATATRQLLEQNHDLSERSISDSLTRLYNHGHLLEVLEREFRRAERSREPLSCLMLDIDHFKAINDTHGHRFGDFILMEIAALLKANVRHSDIVGRYGGEEFMVIVPLTDGAGAGILAEKLRVLVETHTFRSGGDQAVVTASFGVASNTDQGVFTSEQLLALTDRALYFAKEQGRNRVCSAHEYETLTEFDLRRHRLGLHSESAPVVLLLTRDGGTRACVGDLADSEGYQLISFEDPAQFVAEFAALQPNLILLDCAMTPYDDDFVMDMVGRAREAAVPVMAIADESFFTGPAGLSEMVDDFVFDNFRPIELRKKMQALLRVTNLERDQRRLGNELRLAQRRIIKNERLRSIGEMASGMAHEFNNSLSAVLGSAQLMQTLPGLVPEARELCQGISQAATEGAQSVERLQAFLNPQEARDHGRHALARLISEALHLTRSRWRDEALRNGCNITVVNRADPGVTIVGQANELKEVFVNLILNAVDALDQGGTLAFTTEVQQHQVSVAVTDTGRGMTPEILRQIYDPFFTTKHEGNSGFGMHLVYSIMKRHGGRIEIDSQPGQGTSVTLIFPNLDDLSAVAESDTDPVASEAGGVDAVGGAKSGMRILVIDDEKLVRDVHSRILRSLGHTVDTAANGDEALKHAADQHYDVVFTDLSMPQLSGWETARQLRQQCPGAVIVLLSGWGSNQSEDLVRACGISHVLAKPITTAKFRECLERIAATPAS